MNWYIVHRGDTTRYSKIKKRLPDSIFVTDGETKLEGHLAALNKFVKETNDSHAIICEDDVYIHKNYKTIISDLNTTFDIVLLGYLIHRSPHEFGTIYYVKNNVSYYNYPEFFWGAQCYMISREYALKLLSKINTNDTPDQVITKYTDNRVFIYPPVAVEEGISNSEDSVHHWYHRKCKEFLYKELEYF